MTPDVRQQRVAEHVLARGTATAQDLAALFGVSLMTIHRDLDELERRGIVRKYRGGVTAQPSGVFESNVAYRHKAMLTEKRAIARRAVAHLEPGMSVMLDDSTTTYQMIEHLHPPLKVATNFLPSMRRLTEIRDIELLGLGGDYDRQHDSFLGVMCVEAIESIHTDAVFLSTSAVTGGYAYHQEQGVVTVKRAMVHAADRRYLLVDHGKLGRRALHRLVSTNAFDLVIVDSGVSTDALADLDQHNVRYEVADEQER